MADIVGTDIGETLVGTTDADTITGLGGDDIITGDDGDDVLIGGPGADTISGGNGNDIFEMYLDDDFAVGDSIDGGSGDDTLMITNQSAAFLLSTLSYTGIERLLANGVFYGLGVTVAQLNGFNAISGWFNLSGTGSVTLSASTTIGTSRFDLAAGITSFSYAAAAGIAVEVNAGDGGVTVTGSLSNDVLVGGAGDDTLDGGAGNDSIIGGFGSDTMLGGDGDDYFSYTQYADSPAPEVAAGDTVHGGSGNDMVSFYLGDQEATLGLLTYSGIERIQSGGFAALRVTAAELAGLVEIFGLFRLIGAGPVTLDNLEMTGTILLDPTIGSFDFSAATYTEISVDGSSADEAIIAGNGRNNIRGMDGNDIITGGTGYDDIAGGAGDDVIHGGAGDDSDQLYGNGGLDQLYGGGGDDTLDAGLSNELVAGEVYDGGDGFDLLDLFDVFGEDTGMFDLTTVTVTGIEHLYSGMSTTTRLTTAQLLSAAIISGRFILADNAAVSLAGMRHNGLKITLNDAGQTLSLLGSTGFYPNFGSAAEIFGGAGNDIITGGEDFRSELYGHGGNDILTGGILFGGDGDDRLIAVGGGRADGGSGYDTLVISGSISFVGPGSLVSLEAIELVGGAVLTLTGTQFSNGLPIFGTTVTGIGSLIVNLDPNVLFLPANFAIATTVLMTVNGTSGDDVIKAGNTTNTIVAGGGVDFMRGGMLADTINAGAGDDKIYGFGGADVLTGGGGVDQFRYLETTDSGFGANSDRITDFTIGTDKLDFRLFDANPATSEYEAFSFVGTGAFTGGGVASIRYTGSGADLLLQVDVNGDGVADMEVILQGLNGQTLTSGDFMFV